MQQIWYPVNGNYLYFHDILYTKQAQWTSWSVDRNKEPDMCVRMRALTYDHVIVMCSYRKRYQAQSHLQVRARETVVFNYLPRSYIRFYESTYVHTIINLNVHPSVR